MPHNKPPKKYLKNGKSLLQASANASQQINTQ